MAKKKFIKTGQCIWCLKKEPEVTFNVEPHTISRQLGATNIGVDICDSCNHYFGKVDNSQKYPMSVELAFKEIMNVMRLLLKNDLNEKTYKTFKSIYFNYHHSKSMMKFNNRFKLQPFFLSSLTRQFKKGIYEVFLQEYHRVTENALDVKFDLIRKFVREDIGDIPLYFMENNGIYMVEENIDNPSFTFNEHVISHINDYGFYTMLIFGNVFFLEVSPRAELTRDVFLKKESENFIGTGFVYSSLKKLKSITDIDFTLRSLHQKV
ncbi:hypothetical protein [Marinifilum flexuosum]|uniref:hypothetical protein n=1 Tax=Marinifilum flexuosum TaxID=1117708 RepID=UPI002490F7FF|nr:hypothetical protein [Marinifilum flexuosum]